MLICHCRAVSNRAIRDVIAAGARRPEDISLGFGAGSRCGGCMPALLKVLTEHGRSDSPARLQTSAA